jgi:uncharacterized protein (TIGR03083 family)
MAKEPWPTIHAERAALAADLEGLSDDQWNTRSLCDEWTVREVLGHMTAAAGKTPGAFFAGIISNGFKFNAMAAKDVAAQTAGTPADTLARFKAEATSVTHPPGPVDTWLGETIVHAEDIRRPLGIKHEYPADALKKVADFYRRGNLVMGGKRRVAGLKLAATDTDWSAGDGAEVSGPMISIVLAIAGRTAALDDLSGDGVATLKARM